MNNNIRFNDLINFAHKTGYINTESSDMLQAAMYVALIDSWNKNQNREWDDEENIK